jgi:hypothetical protein
VDGGVWDFGHFLAVAKDDFVVGLGHGALVPFYVLVLLGVLPFWCKRGGVVGDCKFRFGFHNRYASEPTESRVFSMKESSKNATQALALIAVALAATLIFASPLINVKAESAASEPSETQQFVHTYTNSSRGNWTSVGKPMFPIYLNDSQIGIGYNWSIVEPLVAGHSYHVYIYGAWVNNGSEPKTDYDIYVYDPRGTLESEHTEAAGLPEHLGTRVNDTFFTPATTGNYTFKIISDARQSHGAEAATFMAIENAQTDEWFSTNIEGKRPDGSSGTNTAWAYEFVTDSPQIQVYIQVPATLDMYEARIYAMSDNQSLIINSAPLPWEPGLYGELKGNIGGYNLNSEGYRGVTYASCEYKGQDMQLNYNTNTTRKTLYQLVLIGEVGTGTVDFLVKTQFNATLTPSNATKNLNKVNIGNETKITYTSESTDLTGAALDYSTDQWNSTLEITMSIESRTCTATIPQQKAGTNVNYRVSANDTLMNTLSAKGSFTVKQVATLNITVVNEPVYVGENVTIHGNLTGANKNVNVTLQFMNAQETREYEANTGLNGTFTIDVPTNGTGVWAVQAAFAGDNATYPALGNQFVVTVEEQPFLAKNGIFVGGGGFFAVVALALVYYLKKRRQ